ncbi:MAG: hypothetical protein ACFBSE_05835 [Prochloraceae cyanobacterium]
MFENNSNSEHHNKQVSPSNALETQTSPKNPSEVCSANDRTEKIETQSNQRSKIKYNFRRPHQLLRFVTEETVAFLFKITVEQIYRIECWQHVVYVHAKGVSRFVSYADFPPVITAEKPDPKDFIYWRKRWVKKFKRIVAPEFWVSFYTNKFVEVESQEELKKWGILIAILKFVFKKTNIKELQANYNTKISTT